MPTRTAHSCTYPGCPRLLRGGRCFAHRLADPPSSRKPAKWRAFARQYLIDNPECVLCRGAAMEVDHIIAIASGGPMYDEDNLRSLCRRCHGRKTSTQDGGFGRPSPASVANGWRDLQEGIRDAEAAIE